MAAGCAAAADLGQPVSPPVIAPPQAYDWSGFFAGANLGYDMGKMDWTAARLSKPGSAIGGGSTSLTHTIDSYTEGGSWVAGMQAGFNYMFANRIVVGGVADLTASAFPNYATGLSTGGTGTFRLGKESYTDNILDTGTFRARVGYAPGNWLLYATGGMAWAYDARTISLNKSDSLDTAYRGRIGWALGGGVEVPLIPHWTASLEYMREDFGNASASYPLVGQKATSNASVNQVKVGVNYQFSEGSSASQTADVVLPTFTDPDRINFHTDLVGIYQGYPSFNSPYEGAKSFRSNGEAREIVTLDLFAGLRLWEGGEFWINPELNQGFGVAGSVGLVGFPNNAAFKIGQAVPYSRVEEYFIRQTFNLGGAVTDLPAGEINFAGVEAANRLVITIGRVPEFTLIGTNKYYDTRAGFGSWNYGFPTTFDFGSDPWGTTYGALGEYYFGRFAVRLGIFDLSQDSEDSLNGSGVVLSNDLSEYNIAGELEEDHTIFGQPGKFKVMGFFDHGYMGDINSAIAYAQANGITPEFEPVRQYATKPGFLLNLEQQVTNDVGLFALFGMQNGQFEIFDVDDSNINLSTGIAISGQKWGRPNDVLGIAGAINNISSEYKRYLSLGGLGVEIGDGQLPQSGPEKNLDVYYKYQILDSTSLTFDYEHFVNPAYNEQRGPINTFSGRVRFYY